MSFHFSPKIITDGLVLYLDVANTRSYPGSGTVWNDLSRSGNNGVLTNGPTFNGNNGGSIVFDGVNDYVNCGNNPSLQITGELTQCAWFKSSNTAQQGIIYKDNQTYRCYKLQTTSTGKGFPIFFSSNIAYNTFEGNTVITNGDWQNLVATYTPSTSVKIYVNGILDATYTSGIPPFLDNDPVNLELGRKGDGTFYLNGNIAQTLIYNRALSSSEVLQNYNATKTRFGL